MSRLRIIWLLLVAFVLISPPSSRNSAIASQEHKLAVLTPAPRAGDIPKGFPQDHFQLARIPAGTFQMGSPGGEVGRSDDEIQHQVTISQSFELQTTLVTQALWQAVMGSNPSTFKGADLPVERVRWNDAQAFIGKLNRMLRTNTYRLPTEAEWEYAARAGKATPFWTGDNLTTDQANYDGNYPYNGNAKGAFRDKTTPVKMFPPNPWGLYDMHGNAYQWCQDWYDDYPSGSVTDPKGPSTGSNRVARGCSWGGEARSCRSAARGRLVPDHRSRDLSFRLARSSP